MSRVMDEAFARMVDAFPQSYETSQMRHLWLSSWSDFPMAVIVRTVDHVIRTYSSSPSLDEFLNEALADAVKVNRAYLRERMAECQKCDMGMVETKPDLFRPCDSCLPEAFERWSHGEYEPTQ